MPNKMRKLLLLLLFPLIFISCGEDDEDFVTQNYLVGNWEISQQGTRSPQGVILYTDYVNNTNCKDNYIFNADFSFESNDYTTTEPCVSTKITGTYDRLSTFVTLNYTVQVGETQQEQSTTLTVISLTYTEAVLAYTNDVNEVVYLKLVKV